ncbi:hypothetical protein [uncultured Sphingomonas sp.]|uniref:hypothetical protein n=1 Tax=uncultured Sphingomonas sp. TaxID=158754 RepID=UPI0025DE9979|nr:hypothetical protein [uncultured Sphingomonas sp.]
MAVEELTALLSHMDEIANAVNRFESEEVQKSAFAALVAAFEGVQGPRPSKAPSSAEAPPSDEISDKSDDTQSDSVPKKRRRKINGSSGRSSVVPVRDLDLRPTGKTAFVDFIAEKKPKDNQERYAVAVYYLEHILELQPVTSGHVAAVFKQTAHWRESGNISSGLRVTARRKNTINTSDLNDLHTTPHGRNFIEHDLPSAEKDSK